MKPSIFVSRLSILVSMFRFLIVLTLGALIFIQCQSDTPKQAAVPEKRVEKKSEIEAPIEKNVADKQVVSAYPSDEKKEVPKPSPQPSSKPVPRSTPKPQPVVAKKPIRTNPPRTNISSKPTISFTKTIYEFGEIDEGDKITHSFEFVNSGKVPLVIEDVSVSCGCTVPSYPIMPIDPGASGSIGIIFNSKGKFGTQKPSITVKSNASTPVVNLYMSGSIKHVFEKTTPDQDSIKIEEGQNL